jgi:hypothetical protein
VLALGLTPGQSLDVAVAAARGLLPAS